MEFGMKEPNGLLTKREEEVLIYAFQGLKNSEIASRLYVSKKTIDFHLSNIYQKLSAKNRVQAITQALRLRVLSP